MKTDQASRGHIFILIAVFLCATANADSVLHKFELWGTLRNPVEKLIFYQGWTNGFLGGRGIRGIELANCLEDLSAEQAIAMIDKRYKDRPDQWSRPIGEQIIQALTVKGGPCEGKNPLSSTSK
jgi:hypothetical protein